MVEALSPNRTNNALDIGPLPGGSRGAPHFLDTHVSHLSPEGIAEDGIAVAQQVTRELVEGKGLPQLLSRPFRRRMGGHVAVNNTTTVMGQYQKHVKDLETEGGHGEEVDGAQLRDVILQKGAPGLRGRFAAAHHVFADAALADVDAQLEQITVNAGCTPTRILPAHPADQVADPAGNDRSSGSAAPYPPGPEQARAATMPGHDRFWFDDGQRRAPVAPDTEQSDPQRAVRGGQLLRGDMDVVACIQPRVSPGGVLVLAVLGEPRIPAAKPTWLMVPTRRFHDAMVSTPPAAEATQAKGLALKRRLGAELQHRERLTTYWILSPRTQASQEPMGYRQHCNSRQTRQIRINTVGSQNKCANGVLRILGMDRHGIALKNPMD